MTTTSIIQVSQSLFPSCRSSSAFLLSPCQPVPTHLCDPNPIRAPHISNFLVNVLKSYACFPPCPRLWVNAVILLPGFLPRCCTMMEKHLIAISTQWLQIFKVNKLSWLVTLCGNVCWAPLFSKECIPNFLLKPCQRLSRYPYFRKEETIIEKRLSLLLHTEKVPWSCIHPVQLLLLSCHSRRSALLNKTIVSTSARLPFSSHLLWLPSLSWSFISSPSCHEHLSLLRTFHHNKS